MIKYFTLILCCLSFATAQAQEFDVITTTSGYMGFTFYDIGTGEKTQLLHEDWDIAFSTAPASAGIIVNEGLGSSMSSTLPEVELYIATAHDYANPDTAGMQRIFNEDITWTSGAFNHVATPGNPLDFGWGSYNPQTHEVIGARLFFIKLRTGAWKKLFIESLAQNMITMKYANLDGTDEITESINRSAYATKSMIFYSMRDETVVDFEPENWDILYTRYRTPVTQDTLTLNYVVTGVLIKEGTKALAVSGVDPETVEYATYAGQLEENIQSIGYDWKSFNLSTFQWVIPEDLVFFIETTNNDVYKLQFVDFEGSATGNTTLAKTFIQTNSSTSNIYSSSLEMSVFPNPTTDEIRFSLNNLQSQTDGVVQLHNEIGQLVYQDVVTWNAGENTQVIPINVAAGAYTVSCTIGNERITQQLFVVK